jgi:hypothetical protein
MVVIIILGIMFATANKRRDQKFVEGNQEYDPALTTGLEDVSDWENKAFRYVGECSYFTIILLRLVITVGVEV